MAGVEVHTAAAGDGIIVCLMFDEAGAEASIVVICS